MVVDTAWLYILSSYVMLCMIRLTEISLERMTEIILSESRILALDAKSSIIILTGTFSLPSGAASASEYCCKQISEKVFIFKNSVKIQKFRLQNEPDNSFERIDNSLSVCYYIRAC